MSTIHLHQTTTSTPEQYVAGLTDLGPCRSNLFGNSADEYLKGLGAFMRAVTELFGPEQARVAAEDWVDELEFVDILPEPAGRDWRSVTIAAAARLAKRLNVDADRRTPRDTPADTKVSPILSSNCPAAIRLSHYRWTGRPEAASALLQDVVGKAKSPCRLVYGVASLPLGAPVELEVIFELAG